MRACLAFFASCFVVSAAKAQDPGLLLQTNLDGAVIAGSKQAVIDAAERGAALRVRWGLDFDEDGHAELIHWSPADFISIWNGEVFTQVGDIRRQIPVRDDSDIVLSEDDSVWRGSIGTNGLSRGAFSGRDAPLTVWPVETTWRLADAPSPVWTMVYRHDAEGAAEAGEKTALFQAIRAGRRIRVGWGLETERDGETLSVEHAADPMFLTILSGAEVAAQLPEHIGQRSYWAPEDAVFENPAVMWRGLMRTDGTFDAVWVNRATGETVRRWPQRAALTWWAEGAPPFDAPNLAAPRGVTRDASRAADRIPQ